MAGMQVHQQIESREVGAELGLFYYGGRLSLGKQQSSITEEGVLQASADKAGNTTSSPSSDDDRSSLSDHSGDPIGPPGLFPRTQQRRLSLDIPRQHSGHGSSSSSARGRLPLGEVSGQHTPQRQRRARAHRRSFECGGHRPPHPPKLHPEEQSSSPSGGTLGTPRGRNSHSARRVSFDIDRQALTYYGCSPDPAQHLPHASSTSRGLSACRLDNDRRRSFRGQTSAGVSFGGNENECSSTHGLAQIIVKAQTISHCSASPSSSDSSSSQGDYPQHSSSSWFAVSTAAASGPATEWQDSVQIHCMRGAREDIPIRSPVTPETSGSNDEEEGMRSILCNETRSSWASRCTQAATPGLLKTCTGLVQHSQKLRYPRAVGLEAPAAYATTAAFGLQSSDTEDVETSEASDAGEFLRNVDKSRAVWARRASLEKHSLAHVGSPACAILENASFLIPERSDSSDVGSCAAPRSKIREGEEMPKKTAKENMIARQFKSTFTIAKNSGLRRLFQR